MISRCSGGASLDLPTLGARARGLGARLFRRNELERLATMADLGSLGEALGRSDRLVFPIARPVTIAAIESAVRHTASHHLRVLSAWAGPTPALDVFYADQDRRIVRAMLRGAIQGAPAELRLAGLLPTPRFPERALTELARQPTPAKVAAHLVVLGHPDADRLLPVASRAQPVLLDLDLALLRGFAERSRSAARAGDRNLRDAVAWRIDVGNAQCALEIAAGPRDVDPATCFVEGGAALSREAFIEACRAESRVGAIERLSRILPLREIVRATNGDPARMEHASLAHSIAEQRRRFRNDPLSSAALVLFLLRLEAQSADVRRLAWAASLGAPPSVTLPELSTPWS